MAGNGINMIMTLCEIRGENANEDALLQANATRKNIAEQRTVRGMLRRYEDIVRSDNTGADGAAGADGTAEISAAEATAIRNMFTSIGLRFDGFTPIGNGNIGVEGDAKRMADLVEQGRARFQDKIKDLEDQDKLDNFEMQTLLSRASHAQAAQSAGTEKIDDADAQVLGNI